MCVIFFPALFHSWKQNKCKYFFLIDLALPFFPPQGFKSYGWKSSSSKMLNLGGYMNLQTPKKKCEWLSSAEIIIVFIFFFFFECMLTFLFPLLGRAQFFLHLFLSCEINNMKHCFFYFNLKIVLTFERTAWFSSEFQPLLLRILTFFFAGKKGFVSALHCLHAIFTKQDGIYTSFIFKYFKPPHFLMFRIHLLLLHYVSRRFFCSPPPKKKSLETVFVLRAEWMNSMSINSPFQNNFFALLYERCESFRKWKTKK